MHASTKKLLPSLDGSNRKVEIAIPAADDLFREIRIENQLTGVDGKPVALAQGTQLTVTLEVEVNGTASGSN